MFWRENELLMSGRLAGSVGTRKIIMVCLLMRSVVSIGTYNLRRMMF
jgi:hypothetical protein